MRRLLAISALVLGSCSSGPTSGKTRIVLSPDRGSALVRELSEVVDGHLTVRADGKEDRQPLFKEEHRKVEDEILESDGLHVQALRRKVVAWTLQRRGPADAAPVSVPISLVGKTYVVRRSDLGTEIEGVEGVPPDEVRANSLEGMEAILSLPEHPVGPGDQWPIDSDRLVAVFGGDGGRGLKVRAAQGRGRLEEITGGTSPVALVSVRIEVEGAFRSLLDVDVTLDFRATFRIDVGARCLLSMEAAADGKIAGEVDRQGKPAVYEGAFRMSSRGSSRPR